MGDAGDTARTGVVVAVAGLAAWLLWKNREDLKAAGEAVGEAGAFVGSTAGAAADAVGSAVSAPFRAAADAGRSTGQAVVSLLTGAQFAGPEEQERIRREAAEQEAYRQANPGATIREYGGYLADKYGVPPDAAERIAAPGDRDPTGEQTRGVLVIDPRTGKMSLNLNPEATAQTRINEAVSAERRRQENLRELEAQKRAEADRQQRRSATVNESVYAFVMAGHKPDDVVYRRSGDRGAYAHSDGSFEIVQNGQIQASGSAGAADGLRVRAERDSADYWPGTRYLRSVVEGYRAKARAGDSSARAWLRRFAPSAAV